MNRQILLLDLRPVPQLDNFCWNEIRGLQLQVVKKHKLHRFGAMSENLFDSFPPTQVGQV